MSPVVGTCIETSTRRFVYSDYRYLKLAVKIYPPTYNLWWNCHECWKRWSKEGFLADVKMRGKIICQILDCIYRHTIGKANVKKVIRLSKKHMGGKGNVASVDKYTCIVKSYSTSSIHVILSSVSLTVTYNILVQTYATSKTHSRFFFVQDLWPPDKHIHAASLRKFYPESLFLSFNSDY